MSEGQKATDARDRRDSGQSLVQPHAPLLLSSRLYQSPEVNWNVVVPSCAHRLQFAPLSSPTSSSS